MSSILTGCPIHTDLCHIYAKSLVNNFFCWSSSVQLFFPHVFFYGVTLAIFSSHRHFLLPRLSPRSALSVFLFCSVCLSLSLNLSLSSITPGRSSKLNPVSKQSGCKFLLVNQHWWIHVFRSIEERRFEVLPYFSRIATHTLFVLFWCFLRWGWVSGPN